MILPDDHHIQHDIVLVEKPERVSWLSQSTTRPALTDSSITGEASGWQPTICINGFTEKLKLNENLPKSNLSLRTQQRQP